MSLKEILYTLAGVARDVSRYHFGSEVRVYHSKGFSARDTQSAFAEMWKQIDSLKEPSIKAIFVTLIGLHVEVLAEFSITHVPRVDEQVVLLINEEKRSYTVTNVAYICETHEQTVQIQLMMK